MYAHTPPEVLLSALWTWCAMKSCLSQTGMIPVQVFWALVHTYKVFEKKNQS